MDEKSFLKQLAAAPGDRRLLKVYAEWLIEEADPRGLHLAAELGVHDAEANLGRAERQLSRQRGTRSEDFDWLNTVFPMITTAPLDGIFHLSIPPDNTPYVKVGEFCNRWTEVGIIEAQNIFYKIPAGYSGMVTDVCVKDGATVATGDVLIKLLRPQKPMA